MYVGLCITLNPPRLLLSLRRSPATGGQQGDTASCRSKKQEPAICPLPAKSCFSLLGKHMSVPKSCCYIGGLVYFLVLSVCSLHPRTSGDGDRGRNERTERDVFFFFFSSLISINLLINMGRTKVLKAATTEIKVLCLTVFFFCLFPLRGDKKKKKAPSERIIQI